jgi:hypothetical protein
MRRNILAAFVFTSLISLCKFESSICITDATGKEWCKNKSDVLVVKRDEVFNDNMNLKAALDCDPDTESDCCNPDVEDCETKKKTFQSSHLDNKMKTSLTMSKSACSLDLETCCDTQDCCEEIGVDCQKKKKSLFEKMRDASLEKMKFQELHLKAAENLIAVQNAHAEQNLKAAKFLIDAQAELNSKKF